MMKQDQQIWPALPGKKLCANFSLYSHANGTAIWSNTCRGFINDLIEIHFYAVFFPAVN